MMVINSAIENVFGTYTCLPRQLTAAGPQPKSRQDLLQYQLQRERHGLTAHGIAVAGKYLECCACAHGALPSRDTEPHGADRLVGGTAIGTCDAADRDTEIGPRGALR